MKEEVILDIAYVGAGVIIGVKLWRWFRAYWTSRKMRIAYEQANPQERKAIEESFKHDPWAAAYTKPMPTWFLIISVIIAFLFLAILIYLGRT